MTSDAGSAAPLATNGSHAFIGDVDVARNSRPPENHRTPVIQRRTRGCAAPIGPRSYRLRGFRGEMLKFLTCNNQVEREAAAQTRNEAALSSVDESKMRPAVRGPQ
jgi:hypothetical protein